MQVTFDLINDKVDARATAAARIGYYIALHDYNDDSSQPGGNILIDGNPAGGATVQLDYPGNDQNSIGSIGTSGYKPGRNYGVRVTNIGSDRFRIEQLVDGLPDEKSVRLTADDLPDGAFGFEFCCGRSFVVDNVVIATVASDGSEHDNEEVSAYLQRYQNRWSAFIKAVEAASSQRLPKPGKLAWVTDLVTPAPDVFLLEQGLYFEQGEKVNPAPPAVLSDHPSTFELPSLPQGVTSSGRRLAFAHWLTRTDSRAAGLLARVMVNRIWQHYFGRGLVATPDNFGQSGSAPSHPELLEYLSQYFVRSGWSIKGRSSLDP